jgi:predicted nuclease of predicted toxin-antitoxin system
MKLILDQGLPRAAATYLREMGYDAMHVGELGLSKASDLQILDLALTERGVVVTLDADFHTLLAISKATQPTVIRIREEGLKGKALAECVSIVVKRCPEELKAGALISVIPPYIRVKLLPLA